MTSMARIVSLAILTILIVFLGITFFQIVAPFLLPLFLAAVTAVWCQPLYGYFQKKFRQRDGLAAAATMTTVCLTLFVPMTVGVVSAANQLIHLVDEHRDGVVQSAKELLHKVRQRTSTSQDEANASQREWATKLLDYVKPLPDANAAEDARTEAVAEREQILSSLEVQLQEASENAGAQLKDLAKRSLSWAASGGSGLQNATVQVVSAAIGAMIGFGMFLIAFYYFLCDGSKLLAATETLIPVQVDYQRQLIQEFNRVMQAVVSATMFSAIAQGAATALALYAVGIHQFFLLFVFATFASLIPVAGTWIVWGPFAAWFCFDHGASGPPSYGSAIFLVVVGVVVIGTMDNLIKAYVLKNDTSLHPLLAFVSVFGGMQVMGLWGIFVGPVVACCLHALVKIFNTELSELSKERFSKSPSVPDAHPNAVPAVISSPATLPQPPAASPASG